MAKKLSKRKQEKGNWVPLDYVKEQLGDPIEIQRQIISGFLEIKIENGIEYCKVNPDGWSNWIEQNKL